MGRGRARAKQTKVARDLKYRSVETDFASLERELRGETSVDSDDYDVDDQYAELASRYDQDDQLAYDEDQDYDERR